MPEPTDLERFLTVSGEEFTFRLSRTELARAGEEQFTTFSPELVEAVGAQMKAWAISRMLLAAHARNQPPAGMAITVRAEATGTSDTLSFSWDGDWVERQGRGRDDLYSVAAMNAVGAHLQQWLYELLAERGKGGHWPQEMELVVAAAPQWDAATTKSE